MKPPVKMTKILYGKRYDIETATLLAGDDYWDGKSWERNKRNHFLYRTPKGAYFQVTCTAWVGELDSLGPVSQSEAIELFEGNLTEHRVNFNQAFPNVRVVDA
jgi:hypothetical protein